MQLYQQLYEQLGGELNTEQVQISTYSCGFLIHVAFSFMWLSHSCGWSVVQAKTLNDWLDGQYVVGLSHDDFLEYFDRYLAKKSTEFISSGGRLLVIHSGADLDQTQQLLIIW